MPDDIGNIICDFRTTRWKSKPYERVVTLLEDNPSQAEMVVRSIIGDLQENPTFLHFAIDCLPADAFPELASFAVEAFRKNTDNEAGADFISRTSLQSPESLHPHLSRIFELKPNWSTYYAQWPWRESGNSHLAFLESVAQGNKGRGAFWRLPSRSHDDFEAAISAMLETRQPEAFAFVGRNQSKNINQQFLHVGFEGGGRNFRKLYADTSFHLGFPSGYFDDKTIPVHLVKRNPTWHLHETAFPPAIFGGEGNGSCQFCGGTLHNLITMPAVPPGIGVTDLPALSLQTCLSCLGYEDGAGTLFYEHDGSGVLIGLNEPKSKAKPKFPAVPLLSAKVNLCLTPKRWRWQDWALSNNRENLNRLGGHPAWIQNADYLGCPKCGSRMCHLMQLDSDLPTSDGGEWLWGSGGCCYVEWCDNCKVSGFQWQCT